MVVEAAEVAVAEEAPDTGGQILPDLCSPYMCFCNMLCFARTMAICCLACVLELKAQTLIF